MSNITTEFTILSSSQASPHLGEGFSSQHEWFPWWQISFKEPVRVEGLTLEGFLEGTSQSPLMTVLVSEDGRNWLPIWTQPFYEINIHSTISVSFQRIFSAKHIRLRYDAYGIISFKKATFEFPSCIGDEQTVEGCLIRYKETAANSQIVISTLFNESDEFLDQYINNFLAFTPENVCLLLNFPAERVIPSHVKVISHRVHVFNGKIRREKWGNTLCLGHLEAFEEAQTIFPTFNYFATMASNALMVRKMDVAAIIEQLLLSCRVPVACERAYEKDIDVDVLEPTYHGTWMWHHFRNTPGLGNYLIKKLELERLSATQIEGLFAHRQDWDLLHVRKSLIEGLEDFISIENYMALEEILPTSIIDRFGTGQYTHICRVLWSGTRQVTISDLLEMVPAMPDHFCALKWFERSRTALPTIAVTTSWGRTLLEIGQNRFSNIEQFQKVTLAKTLLSKAREAERFGPLTNRWWPTDVDGQEGLNWSVTELVCNRQQIELDIPNRSPSRVAPAYLYMEATNQRISMTLNIRETEEKTILQMSCSALTADGAPVPGVHLQGYLYLSGLQGDTIFCLTIPHGKCCPHDVLSRTVLHDEYSYVVNHADRVENLKDVEKRYFISKIRESEGHVWLGLPIQCNTSVEVGLSVGPNYHNNRKLPI